jgi:hypothetical protein
MHYFFYHSLLLVIVFYYLFILYLMKCIGFLKMNPLDDHKMLSLFDFIISTRWSNHYQMCKLMIMLRFSLIIIGHLLIRQHLQSLHSLLNQFVANFNNF